MNQNVRAAIIGIRNILLGANLRSLAKLVDPRQLAFYSTQALFFYDCLFRNGLAVKNAREVLPHREYEDVTFFLPTDEFSFNAAPIGSSALPYAWLITP